MLRFRFALTLVGALAFAVPTAAADAAAFAPVLPVPGPGKLAVNPSIPSVGSTVTVTYENRDMAGQTVQVRVDNGDSLETQVQWVEIQLDGRGRGSAPWAVPNWPMAKFNAPGANEVATPVVGWNPAEN